MLDEKTLNWFTRNGLKPPEQIKHDLTPDDIASKVVKLVPSKWRLEGNRLIAETDMGELVNYIPTDYILTGTDAQGLPILQRI